MNKTMKRNVVVSALLAIMLCVSLIAGATFALFTSESKTNVAVTSGKVDVKASIVNFKSSHPVSIDMGTKEPSDTYLDGFWGGLDLASYNAETNSIELNKMVAGDKVTFDLVITNYSTVPVKFKTTYTATGDQDLLDVLDISVGNSTGWISLDAASEGGSVVNTLNCYVEMPCSANVQGKSCALSFLVEAVQGNADVDVDNSVVYISNADEFIAFANGVNSGVNYEHKSVYLTNDIDLTGKTFNGIGGKHTTVHVFDGLFDGQNHTVKNFSVAYKCPDIDEGGNYQNGCFDGCDLNNSSSWDVCAGLFTQLGGNGIVKNLIVSNANVNSTHYAGGIVGYAYKNSKIENCKVIDSNITSEAMTIGSLSDCGDKAGGIAGYIFNSAVVNKCSVKNTTITAYRDLGAVVGYANDGTTVTNCTIEDGVVVKVDRSVNYKNYTQNSEYDAGNFVGQADAVIDVVTGNTGSATILNYDRIYNISNETELFAFASDFNALRMSGDVAVFLTNDITLTQEWTPMARRYNANGGLLQLTFDGGNHTISNVANSSELRQGGFFGEYSQSYSSLTVKNLKLNNVSFKGDFIDDDNHEDSSCGAVIAYIGVGSTVTIENVVVTGIDISGFKYSGGIAGYVSTEMDFIIDNCAVIGTETMKKINSKNHVGGFAGYLHRAHESGQTIIVKNSSIKNIAVSSTDSTKGREGAVVGTLQADCKVKNITVEGVTVQDNTVTATNLVGVVNLGVVEDVTII